MSKVIPKEVKEKVERATEIVLEEAKEVDMYKIKELLEKEYKIKFFNGEVLKRLIQEALNNIVYIYC